MEQRKLIKLGNSSFAIALPKDWIDKSGLKKGDDIFVTPNSNGELIIASDFKKQENGKEAVINLDEKDEDEIARDIISAYTSGNKSIRVIGKKPKIDIAKHKAKNFLNLELIEENEKEAVFKDLLDLENVNIENFIKRMDNNIKEMFSILLEISQDDKKIKSKSKELDEIDRDTTKFYFLIWRFMNIGIDNPSLQHSLNMSSKSFLFYFWISYNLEQIGDELKRIPKKLESSGKGKEILLHSVNFILDRYNKSMKSFFDKNKDLAKESILSKKEVGQVYENLSSIPGLQVVAEKLQTINGNIHNNSKLIFYEI